jgi:hypothetical protein
LLPDLGMWTTTSSLAHLCFSHNYVTPLPYN